MSKLLVRFLIIMLFSGSVISVSAQKNKGKTPKQAAKEQSELQGDREKKIEKEIASKKEGHQKIQDKKTRKRMKRNLKKSQRVNSGKPTPFYKRWFRRKKR